MIQLAWIRDLRVILTSKNKNEKKMLAMTFGNQWEKGKEDVHIHVSGQKFLSALQDSFTVEIDNLTYNEIIFLTANQYFKIEIQAGYRNRGTPTIFKGEVMYISMELTSNKTHKAIILCASRLIALFGQSRMNLTLSSGINMYSALDFIRRRAGVGGNASLIDESLKNRIIQETTSVNSTLQSWLKTFTDKNNMVVNTDSSEGVDLTLFNPYKRNPRMINLTGKHATFTGGYPKVRSDGIQFSIMPTFNFLPGDVIKIDNSIIDISATSSDDFLKAIWLNQDGKYMIYQLSYELDNRSNAYTITVYAKNRDIYTNVIKNAQVEGYQ